MQLQYQKVSIKIYELNLKLKILQEDGGAVKKEIK